MEFHQPRRNSDLQRLDPLVPARGCTTAETQKPREAVCTSNDDIVTPTPCLTLPIAHPTASAPTNAYPIEAVQGMCPAMKQRRTPHCDVPCNSNGPFSQSESASQGIPSCPEDKPFSQLMWLDTRNNP